MAKSRDKTDRPTGGSENDVAPDTVTPESAAAERPRRRREGKPEPEAAKEKEASPKVSGRSAARAAPANSIRPTRAPERAGRAAGGPAPAEGAKNDGERQAAATDPATTPSPSAAPAALRTGGDSAAVPQSVRDRFVQDGRRYYFPDGAPAFKDLGKRLTTQSENTEVVASLIGIAEVRGWNEVTVSGTDRFRREAWRQARLAGLEVRGYKPTAVEQAQLVRAIAARGQGEQREFHLVSEPGEPGDASQPESARPEGDAARRGSAPAKPPTERISGKLLDHGHDTYRHDPHEPASYFVRIQTKSGQREFWGLDIERAIGKSLTQPQIGEKVTLQRAGRETVTVKRHERDPEGKVIASREVVTFRNRWVIERSDFFEERAAAAGVLRDPSIAPRQAVRNHPELAGTYLNLKAAEIAARAIRDPQDQKRFVALVRSAMADQIERGEPLQPVRLRERDSRTLPRDREAQARG